MALNIPQSTDDIKETLGRIYRNRLISLGVEDPKVFEDSETDARFSANAHMFAAIVSGLSQSVASSDESTATGDDLDRIMASVGLARLSAVGSSGSATAHCLGTCIAPDGAEIALDNGTRVRVVGTQSITDGAAISIESINVGAVTNAAAGTKGKWLAPPPGVNQSIEVIELSGGADAETDGGARMRLQAARKTPPGAGNWAALQTAATVSADLSAYVYPALGGPGSALVALAGSGQSRVATQAQIDRANGAIAAEYPGFCAISVVSVVSQSTSLAIGLNLSKTNGWKDFDKYPRTAAAVTGLYYGAPNSIAIYQGSAIVPNSPKYVLIHKSATNTWVEAITTVVDMGSGIHKLNLNCSASGISVGDLVMPTPTNWKNYVDIVNSYFAELAPGEYPMAVAGESRFCRHPEDASSSIDSTLLTLLESRNQEINGTSYLAVSKYSPDVASSINVGPNVLTLGKLGFYPIST